MHALPGLPACRSSDKLPKWNKTPRSSQAPRPQGLQTCLPGTSPSSHQPYANTSTQACNPSMHALQRLPASRSSDSLPRWNKTPRSFHAPRPQGLQTRLPGTSPSNPQPYANTSTQASSRPCMLSRGSLPPAPATASPGGTKPLAPPKHLDPRDSRPACPEQAQESPNPTLTPAPRPPAIHACSPGPPCLPLQPPTPQVEQNPSRLPSTSTPGTPDPPARNKPK